MTWKIAWEDLQSTKLGARGQFGSRYSLGRMSLAEMVCYLIALLPHLSKMSFLQFVEKF